MVDLDERHDPPEGKSVSCQSIATPPTEIGGESGGTARQADVRRPAPGHERGLVHDQFALYQQPRKLPLQVGRKAQLVVLSDERIDRPEAVAEGFVGVASAVERTAERQGAQRRLVLGKQTSP